MVSWKKLVKSVKFFQATDKMSDQTNSRNHSFFNSTSAALTNINWQGVVRLTMSIAM